jgi:GTPase SAR1 family protein
MSSSAKHNDMVFKVIVVGDSGCGKSCLIQRYLTNEFLDDYTVTLGVEYHSKSIKIDGNINIKLQFWDTAGQEAFHSLVKAFYRNAHAVVLVFDITRCLSSHLGATPFKTWTSGSSKPWRTRPTTPSISSSELTLTWTASKFLYR